MGMATGCTDALDGGVDGAAVPESSEVAATDSPASIPFDPCRDVDASVFERLGFDPAEIEVDEMDLDTVQSLGCTAQNRDRALSLMATNSPYERVASVPHGEIVPVLINGREALHAINTFSDDDCTVIMRADFGAVTVDVVPKLVWMEQNLTGCHQLIETAEAIEPFIRDGS